MPVNAGFFGTVSNFRWIVGVVAGWFSLPLEVIQSVSVGTAVVRR